jgi:hypothetical protein
VQQLFDNIANCFELCTKRTARKEPGESWESNLDSADIAKLSAARTALLKSDSMLTPTSTQQDFEKARELRKKFEATTAELRREAVERLAVRERAEARQHAATWKLLSSFNQKRVQPEVPPSVIYEHYKEISQVSEAPLLLDEAPGSFVGPLTREDAKLEDDISLEETKSALENINLQSAPGPDGLPPRLVTSIFSTTLLMGFLARLLTRCFRSKWIPAQWRSSENFVLYKGKGDTTDVSSFRAISLTLIFAKVRTGYCCYCVCACFWYYFNYDCDTIVRQSRN